MPSLKGPTTGQNVSCGKGINENIVPHIVKLEHSNIEETRVYNFSSQAHDF